MQETVRRFRSRSRYAGRGTADLSWQERVRRVGNPYGYVSQGRSGRERMTFGVELPDMGADMQPVYLGSRGPGARTAEMNRRRRDKASREVAPVSRGGLRGTVALALLAVLALALLICWRASRADIRATERRIARTEARIEEVERRRELLAEELEKKTADVDVAFTAAGQGMISSKGAERISITVPSDAVVMPYIAAEN